MFSTVFGVLGAKHVWFSKLSRLSHMQPCIIIEVMKPRMDGSTCFHPTTSIFHNFVQSCDFEEFLMINMMELIDMFVL